MDLDDFSQVECGLDLSPSALQNKKLVLIRHPRDMDVADVLGQRKISLPKKGVLSKPILPKEDCQNNVNYKLMMDKDPTHENFRAILKGGEIAPAFSSTLSIVQSVEDAGEGVDVTAPAITAYEKIPRVEGLKPCLLPLGSAISQKDLTSRIATIESSVTTQEGATTPVKDKKKKRKSLENDVDPPTTGKKKKEKKSKSS